jgi:[ribosomal protein S18]-alanine N-acetyltransferase
VNATSTDPRSEAQIRQLSLADLDAVMEIELASFTTPWRHATFAGLLARPDADLIGAVRHGSLVAYAVCWTVGDQAELGNVAVSAPERRRGTGRRLVRAVLERVRERGATECFLEVRESNLSAIALYEQCGFTSIGVRRRYYTKPVEDAIVLRCILA